MLAEDKGGNVPMSNSTCYVTSITPGSYERYLIELSQLPRRNILVSPFYRPGS